jgi:TolB protein
VGDPNMSAYDPAFSPDSRKILFRSDLNESGFALQVMNVDGTDIRNLSRSVIEVGAPDELGTRGFDWSHDGRLIVFGGSELRDGKDDLYVVPADGSAAPRRITTGRRDVLAATWSPTGDRIVFLRENDERPYREVIVANADGSRERVIARQVAAVSPQWSPDGHAVVICRDGTGYERTFSIIPVDGGGTPIDIHVVIPDAAGSLSTAPGLDTVGWQRR